MGRERVLLGIREREKRLEKRNFSGVHTLKHKLKHNDEVHKEVRQRCGMLGT